MHRSYNSTLPTANKLLQQKWDTTYYNEHRRKVKDVQSIVDTKAPSTYIHLHLKLKKFQLEEEKLTTIERDNRILLEKMAYIMRTKGRVDNRNNYEYVSLNREKRQRELLRVAKDNQEILRRITARQPEYSAKKWEEDWKKNQKFMDEISHFPQDWWIKGKKNDNNRSKSRQSVRSRKSVQSASSNTNNDKTTQQKQTTQEKATSQEKETTQQKVENQDESETEQTKTTETEVEKD